MQTKVMRVESETVNTIASVRKKVAEMIFGGASRRQSSARLIVGAEEGMTTPLKHTFDRGLRALALI